MAHTVNAAGFYPISNPARHPRGTMARWTGERRPPHKGEWFLSGAVVEAYEARADLTQTYHTARLCLTRTVTTIVEILPDAVDG